MHDILICAATALESRLLSESYQVLETGVGSVNAAYALTKYLQTRRPSGIVVCGIGGAYPASGLNIGDVCAAESECYGDLGVETPTGFLTVRELGFAALDVDQIPMQLFPHARRLPFVTVNTCSGTNDLSSRIQARTNGAVESMEGAAIAHVAARERIPCGEIRGISNFTGDRDRSTWRVREAAEAAQQALLEWLTTH